MANYGLYDDVNEAQLLQDVQDLKSKLNVERQNLDTFKLSVNNDLWTANAKNTFISGLSKINDEAYEQVLSGLNRIEIVAQNISRYKYNRSRAMQIQSDLQKVSTPEMVDAWKAFEKAMDDCEVAISSMCSGG